jgi:hypothetical protein
MKPFLVLALIFVVLNQCNPQNQNQFFNSPPQPINYPLTPEQSAFLDTLQQRTFLYFWHEANPDHGLVKDRSTAGSPCSIAAVGFGIVAWAIGAEHGWITRDQALERTLNCLRFFWRSEQSTAKLATGYQGFYYHFLDMKTGKRFWNCELSTIDTAWLLAGVRFAAHYYHQNSPAEREIRELADRLTFRVNWDWAALPDTGRFGLMPSMGWTPEEGFNPLGWYGYTEAQYIYILAAGSGYRHADKAYQRWFETYHWDEPYPGLAHATFPPLFGHQWTKMFVDLRGLVDDYMAKKSIDYFENSRRATLTQRRYAIDNPSTGSGQVPNGWAGYDSLTWGWTACDGPGSKFNTDSWRFHEYAARGISGPRVKHDYQDDGTIAPTAAAGSIVFAPEIVIPTLINMYQKYGARGLWGRYGFVDAFNPTVNWYDSDYLGIDQGPILLMIENFRTGLVWKYCMKDPVIQKGLKRLGFRKESKH